MGWHEINPDTLYYEDKKMKNYDIIYKNKFYQMITVSFETCLLVLHNIDFMYTYIMCIMRCTIQHSNPLMSLLLSNLFKLLRSLTLPSKIQIFTLYR